MVPYVVISVSCVSCNYAEIREYRSVHRRCQDVGNILPVLIERGTKIMHLLESCPAQTEAYFVCIFMRQSNL